MGAPYFLLRSVPAGADDVSLCKRSYLCTMDNIASFIPQEFPPESRVWVYQSSRPFDSQEEAEISEQLCQFYLQWRSHGRPVKGWAGILFHQFIVIMANDMQDRLCGTAVDGSIRFIKSFEMQYQVQLLDRMLTGFLVNDKIELLPLQQVPYALEKGFVTADTLYFNNAVTTKHELESRWLIPLKDSWLGARFLGKAYAG